MNDLEHYIDQHITPEDPLLTALDRETHMRVIQPRMISGHLQGKLLEILVRMLAPKRILEIGTFTGYSALSMAEALPDGAELHTIEIDDEMEDFIRAQFASVPHGSRITLHIGDALEVIPRLGGQFDLVFIDADKRLYDSYFDLVLPLLPPGGIILADNTLWDGKVLLDNPPSGDHQTLAIKAFNDRVASDPRVSRVILPLRDGLTIIRKL